MVLSMFYQLEKKYMFYICVLFLYLSFFWILKLTIYQTKEFVLKHFIHKSACTCQRFLFQNPHLFLLVTCIQEKLIWHIGLNFTIGCIQYLGYYSMAMWPMYTILLKCTAMGFFLLHMVYSSNLQVAFPSKMSRKSCSFPMIWH